ncbi:motility protein [Leifsonia xyli subsp. xyli]|uniref:Motility protein n=2 Tax=Leifsonia xyli subsp. xyli TaxID=59736 RepID=Q6AGA1_LEIXX|nr:flagellar FlbD family protein [Leifsonia xyli]AAT88594.1 motility protein [Leifsonia xyli subsp. xyli str. CTCB07]ODA90538.1 motility protein [Leifsonia xyli subsp. xyli]
MIKVTKLNGAQFAVNPDLIERITSDPDSAVTMVDGVRYVVLEDVDTIIDLIAAYRAKVLAVAYEHGVGPLGGGGSR